MAHGIKPVLTLLLASLLVACGGGGGGGGGSSSDSPTAQQPTTPVTPSPNTPVEPEPEPTPDPEPIPEPEPEPEPEPVSVTLSWAAPTTRENGDPLLYGDIAGYEIYYFKDNTSQENDQVVTISDPSVVEHTINDLTAGTYFFAIATVDIDGLYSDTSDYVELNID